MSKQKTIISPIWDKFLHIKNLKQLTWFQDIIHHIDTVYSTSTNKVCPDRHNIFKMFQLCNPDEIKVFMMFQDPYPQLRKGNCVADGVGLSASYLTPSLKHFHKAIDENYKESDIDITMMSLVLQGVFSINKYLTVSKIPLSHSSYNGIINNRPLRWDLFMHWVLTQLNRVYTGIPYIFFGKEASDLSKIIDVDTNLVIKTSHPSPRGYKYGIMESKFAQRTNKYLKNNNKLEIIW